MNLDLLSINSIIDFTYNNLFLILIGFLTYVGICFDIRFKLKNKVFIGLGLSFLFLFLLLFNIKDISIWLQELFWYTIIINISFVLHICYLNWLYIYCWNRRYQYLCFLISRLSFILSLTFVIYTYKHILRYIYIYFWTLIEEIKIFKGFFNFMFELIIFFLQVIKLILHFFVITFANYSLLIQGNLNKTFTWRNIIFYILIIIITLILSIFIFGIPRLYIIWIYIFIYSGYEAIIEYWEEEKKEENKNFFEIIIYLLKDEKWRKKIIGIINEKQWNISHDIYSKPYLYTDRYLDTGCGSNDHYIWYLLRFPDDIKNFKTIFKYKDWYSQIREYWDYYAATWDLEFDYEMMIRELEHKRTLYNLTEEEVKKLKDEFHLEDPEKFWELYDKYFKKRIEEKRIYVPSK